MTFARRFFYLLFRFVPAFIMLQTLQYKLTGDPLSIHIFTTLGIEPWGRYMSGFSELAAGLLLLFPMTAFVGAIMGIGIMAVAVVSHLTLLGVNVQGDGGTLFSMAVVTLLCCAVTLYLERRTIKKLKLKLLGKDGHNARQSMPDLK